MLSPHDVLRKPPLDHLETFNACRKLLFGIAYRMLGSVHDAEDIVQDAYIRWERVDHTTVENPQAFLCTMVTRMSIDLLRSARKQRETYVGAWLPEPLATEGVPALDNVALAESLSTAFLLMLERLNPVERAAFLLREVFDYEYPEVAGIIGKSEDNCRQIVRRAKERVQAPALRFEAREDARDTLLSSFMSAVRDGEVHVLVNLLAGDAALYSDHGGKATAARRTIHGADKIARFFIGVDTRFRPADFSYRFTWLNGAPGVIVYSGARAETAFSVEIEDGKIRAFYVTRNPDKLAHLPGPVGTDARTPLQ